jgi:hypothetical protein
MIQFILTVVQDTDKDEDVIADLDEIVDDQFDIFIDGLMQNYPSTEYCSSVDWGYGDSEGHEEEVWD